MIIIDDINTIIEWDLSKLWNAITQIDNEDKIIFKEQLEQIEEGIDIQCNINYIINEEYTEYPERNSVKLKYYGTVNYIEFKDDIKKREILARNIIYELNQENKIMKSPEGFDEE